MTITKHTNWSSPDFYRRRGAFEKRKIKEMAMSKDRVHFYITGSASHETPLRDAFEQAFGRECPKVSDFQDPVLIICRPSQFARFLIFRNDNGGRNSFKLLAPELVTPVERKNRTIDVSESPAKYAC